MSKAQLDRLVDEATVDAYGEAEQAGAFYTVIGEKLRLPFETQILGIAVVVERLELTDRDEIVAVCRRGEHRQRVLIVDLPLPSPAPDGAEWIAAYRHWLRPDCSC